jgi:hypothetical protein
MSESATPRPFEIRAATAADRGLALDLLRRAFGESDDISQSPERWDWLFLRNTADVGLRYLVADAGGELAGQYPTVPTRMQHRGRELVGLLPVDIATNPDFTRRGIFTTLAKQLYDASASTAPLVFGFPNVNSSPGYYGRLGWVELRPYPSLVRPLGNFAPVVRTARPSLGGLARAGDVVARGVLSSGWWSGLAGGRSSRRVERLTSFGGWADTLWEANRGSLGTCAIRDARYLNWRFCEGPYAYSIYGLVRDGEPEGFVVVTSHPWRGGHVADLMELAVLPGDEAGARMLLTTAILDAVERGAFVLRAIVGPTHPQRGQFKHLGFARLPRRFARQESFGAAVLDGNAVNPNEVFHIEDWYISGADLDFV